VATKLGAGIKVILDMIKETQGEVEFSAEQAEAIWGGTEACKIKDLTQTQLLQFALASAHQQREELVDIIDKMVAAENEGVKNLNRAARRKLGVGKTKSGLILPE
jgi:hypothetical protein